MYNIKFSRSACWHERALRTHMASSWAISGSCYPHHDRGKYSSDTISCTNSVWASMHRVLWGLQALDVVGSPYRDIYAPKLVGSVCTESRGVSITWVLWAPSTLSCGVLCALGLVGRMYRVSWGLYAPWYQVFGFFVPRVLRGLNAMSFAGSHFLESRFSQPRAYWSPSLCQSLKSPFSLETLLHRGLDLTRRQAIGERRGFRA
jgi:hypothetical protein